MLDIVIPILNEEKVLREKSSYWLSLKEHAQLIFVDGGSTDHSVQIAKQWGEVIRSPKGRAIQKNAGFYHGQSPIVLFLHIDTEIDPDILNSIKTAVQNPGIAAACFRLRIQTANPIFRVFEFLVNVRARFWGVLDGDLGLAVERSIFEKIHAFDIVYIMEDILMSDKIRSVGRVHVLPADITTSNRVWKTNGYWRTLARYTRHYLTFWFRPHTLRKIPA